MARYRCLSSSVAALCLCLPVVAFAAPVAGLGADLIASGYDRPLFLTHAPGERDKL